MMDQSSSLSTSASLSRTLLRTLPLLCRCLFPELVATFALTSMSFKRVIDKSTDWEGAVAHRFCHGHRVDIQSFSNSLEVLHLPPSFWRREYVMRYRAYMNKCSFCAKKPIYTEGEFCVHRGLKMCISCWEENVWDEEKAQASIRMSMSKEVSENLSDMEVMLLPSFSVNTVPFYLKSDLSEFASLISGADLRKPQDIFNSPWREQLRLALIEAGMDLNLAESFALNTFPPDGTPLTQIIGTILHSSPEFTQTALNAINMKMNEDSVEESSSGKGPNLLLKKSKLSGKAHIIDESSNSEGTTQDDALDAEKHRRRLRDHEPRGGTSRRKKMTVAEPPSPGESTAPSDAHSLLVSEEDFESEMKSVPLAKPIDSTSSTSSALDEALEVLEAREMEQSENMDIGFEINDLSQALQNLSNPFAVVFPAPVVAAPKISRSESSSSSPANDLRSREEELKAALRLRNVSWNRATSYPYKTVVEHYLNGKGGYNLEGLVETLDSASFKHDSLIAALDSISLGTKGAPAPVAFH